MKKTEKQWRDQLGPERYQICREGGTEPPFSGEHYYRKEPGIYYCVCCQNELFDARDKYDSGSGWPSYTQPVSGQAVIVHLDTSHGMRRQEVKCAVCEAHLGHVFPDGPAPGNCRYCVNSAAMLFKKHIP